MSVVLAARVESRPPVVGARLTIAVVLIAASVLSVVLSHLGDPIPADDTAAESSPSSMF